MSSLRHKFVLSSCTLKKFPFVLFTFCHVDSSTLSIQQLIVKMTKCHISTVLLVSYKLPRHRMCMTWENIQQWTENGLLGPGWKKLPPCITYWDVMIKPNIPPIIPPTPTAPKNSTIHNHALFEWMRQTKHSLLLCLKIWLTHLYLLPHIYLTLSNVWNPHKASYWCCRLWRWWIVC